MADSADPTHARLAEEASAWLEKIERTLTDEEAKSLRDWLKPKIHREILVDRCKRWHGAEILAVLAELMPTETIHDRVERQYGRLVLAICLWISGISLITVLTAFSKVVPWSDARNNPLRAEVLAATEVGGRRILSLPDGGSIELNTATRLFMDYEPRSREVTLHAGEALFHAKYDPARAFRVYVAGRSFEVEPGDARFNLRKVRSDRVELTVLSGRIRVHEGAREEVPSPDLLRTQVSYGPHLFSESEGGTLGRGWQIVARFSEQQRERRVAWRAGHAIFENELLEDALQELERYTTTRFAFVDPGLRTTRLTADLRLGDVDGVRRYLRDELRILSRQDGQGRILLSGARDTPAWNVGCLPNYSCRSLTTAPTLRFVHGLTQAQ